MTGEYKFDAAMNPTLFHDHLDECEQCREHPFNLCEEGARILEETSTADTIPGRF